MARLAVPVFVLGLALAACSSGSDSVPTETREPTQASTTTEPVSTTEAPTTTAAPTTQAPTTTEPTVDPIEYLEQVFTGDLSDPAALVADAAPSSPAELYGKHQINVRLANRDAGTPEDGSLAITQQGDIIKSCSTDPVDGGEFCASYSDFVVDAGLLYSFSVDGIAIDDRLGGEGAPSSALGAEAKVLTSYRSASGDALFVTMQITAAVPVQLSLFSAAYVDPSGRQVNNAGYVGPDFTVRAGANVIAYVVFQQADTGGTVFIDANSEDFSSTGEFQLNAPVAAFG